MFNNQLFTNLAYINIYVTIATQNLGFVFLFFVLIDWRNRLSTYLIRLTAFDPETCGHCIIKTFCECPSMVELVRMCIIEKPSPITIRSKEGEEHTFYLVQQQFHALKDKPTETEEGTLLVPNTARFVVVKVAELCGEPKYWLVVCGYSQVGWLLPIQAFVEDDEEHALCLQPKFAVAPI